MCSSSLTAMHLACESIRRGECQVAVSGGVNLSVHVNKYIMLGQGNFLSSDGRCRSFGEGGDGYVPGEGVGAVLLKSLKKAEEDGDQIYGVIKGTAINHGGKVNGYTVPDPNAQARLIVDTLKKSNIDPRTVSYIEAHGTGTSMGDPIEISGLTKAFNEYTSDRNFCSIGSIKSNIGHLESASGIASITKVLLQMKHKQLVPSIHSDVKNPNIDFNDSPFYVQNRLEDWKQPVIMENGRRMVYPRRAGISSFGAGGANAHIILEEYQGTVSYSEGKPSEKFLILLSAKNEDRLKVYSEQLYEFLEEVTAKKVEKGLDEKLLLNSLRLDLIEICSEVTKVSREDIDWDMNMEEYGFDPVMFNALAEGLANKYDINLNVHVFMEIDSLQSLMKYLLKNCGDKLEEFYGEGAKKGAAQDEEKGLLGAVAYTLQIGREAMEERMAFVVENMEQLREGLYRYFKSGSVQENGFKANIKQNTDKLLLLTEGEEGNELISSLLRNKKLNRLAHLWVYGAEVDWRQLYRGSRCPIVSLPVYPFAKERYWVPKTSHSKVNADISKLHPMIDKNISDLREQKFISNINGDELYLDSCSVLGLKALPGMACLEIMRAAGELSVGERVISARDIQWMKPIMADESSGCQITASLYEVGLEEVGCGLYLEDGERSLCVHGTLIYGASSSNKDQYEKMDIQGIKSKCAEVMDSGECYRVMDGYGMKYGSNLRVIREFAANGDESITWVKLPAEVKDSVKGLVLHPLLMEGIIQAAIVSAGNNSMIQPGPYMPFEMGMLEIAGELPEECYIHTILTQTHKGEKTGITYCNIKVADLSGRVLLDVKELGFAPVELKCRNELSLHGEAGGATAQFLLEKEWRKSPVSRPLPKKLEGTIVVLTNEEMDAAGLIPGDSAGLKVVKICRGARFEKVNDGRYIMDFSRMEHGIKAAGEILENGVAVTAFVDLSDIYSKQVETVGGCMAKITLMQQLIKNFRNTGMDIVHLTKGLQTFNTGDTTLAGADFAGFVKMMGAEYGKIKSVTIDLDIIPSNFEALWDRISSELDNEKLESEVCYRSGERYIPCMKKALPTDLAPGYGKFQRINSEKVIVVTGGTRGMGAESAKYLVEKGARKLVLMGVQKLPPRDQWNSIQSDPNTRSDIKEKIGMIQTLEKNGAQVEIYIGSLTQKDRLEEYFDGVRNRLGEIGGVIHCAGLKIDKNPAFINKKPEDIQRVFEPKFEGLQVLHQVFQKDVLEFFILFSSVSGLMPVLGGGVSDYAAANAFMDFYAAYRYSKGDTYYRSIQWPMWKGVGMGEMESPVYRHFGLVSHSVQDGFNMLEESMKYGHSPCLMPCVAYESRLKPEELLKIKHEISTTAAYREEASGISKKSGTAQTGHIEASTLRKLKELFSQELGIPEEKLDIHMTFDDMGVDSVLLAEMVRRVENWVGAKVEPSMFLEHPTLERLGRYIEENYLGGDTPKDDERVMPDDNSDVGKVPACLVFKPERELKLGIVPVNPGRAVKAATGICNEAKSGKIAVIGVACNFPGAKNKDAYWRNLAGGVSSISEIPGSRWSIEEYFSPEYQKGKSISKWGGFIEEVEYFDPDYFNINEEDAYSYDPLIRQFMEVSVQTLRDAGYENKELWGKKVGVFVGARAGAFAPTLEEIGKSTIAGIGQNFIAAHVSHFFNFKGPNMVIDTACSSSLVSAHLACRSLIEGESEAALAGGVDILLNEQPYLILSESRALSPDGKCHTFDENANGFVPGEGCGAVLLKPLEKAIADGDRIYAVIEASAVNNDGHTMGLTTPNPDAQSEVILEALNKGNIVPDSISYIETHGTGTMIGDPIELKALKNVFQKPGGENQFCAVGSVKSNFGHLLSAAGIASLIKVVLSIRERKIPPTLNCESPNPRFKFEKSPFYPNTELKEWKPRMGVRRAGISSFGFGGTNAHMILCEPDIKTTTGYQAKRTSLPPVVFNKKRFWKDSKDKVAPRRDIGTISAPVSGIMAEVKEETLYHENLYRLLKITDESDDGPKASEDTVAARFVVPLLEITDESDDEQYIKREQVKMAPILEITDETENQF
ncbi:MAG: beta-ketoacyl synthase N-terminal-like domain-containing protein [Bacillota bacterium]|nr:beta-ketoacyl synthase N-terminal-like domain-containing protein [Bacillota bacterium]